MAGSEMAYAEALVASLEEALAGDPRVHIMGQYFLGLTPRRALMAELRSRYPERVWDPPIAENGYVGTAIGAAMAGLRPIVDIATASFIFQAWSQVVNEAANIHYMTGGQTRVPLVMHFNHGIRIGGAAQHSHSPQAMLWNTPGLQIMAPSTPADVLGLMRTAVASDNPVVFVDAVRLFETRGVVPEGREAIPFGVGQVRREGSDVTLVACSISAVEALAAAEEVAASDGISVEVVDPRTLVPFDLDCVLRSVAKTGRLVVTDETHRSCGVTAEIAARVAESGFDLLRAPIRRVATEDVPVPFARPLEERIQPDAAKIAAAVREVAGVVRSR